MHVRTSLLTSAGVTLDSLIRVAPACLASPVETPAALAQTIHEHRSRCRVALPPLPAVADLSCHVAAGNLADVRDRPREEASCACWS